LNSIDGVCAPFNVVFIFTTNHIEKLDPALLRPGRIDLCVEIKPVCLETFTEFMIHHFGDIKIPKTLKIKDGITFAKLQLMVMNHASPKEIMDYVKEK
jgi:ATP-dependent 26S proteasome regulatory subunit